MLFRVWFIESKSKIKKKNRYSILQSVSNLESLIKLRLLFDRCNGNKNKFKKCVKSKKGAYYKKYNKHFFT